VPGEPPETDHANGSSADQSADQQPAGARASKSKPRRPDPADDRYIPFECRVCGGEVFGKITKVGRYVSCAGCGAKNQVPPKVEDVATARRKVQQRREQPDQSQVESNQVGSSFHARNEAQISEAYDDSEEAMRRRMHSAMKTGIVNYLFQPVVLIRWFGLTLVTGLLCYVVALMVSLVGNPLGDLIATFLTVVLAIVFAWWLSSLSNTCLGVVESASEGQHLVSDFSGEHLLERLGDSAVMMSSLAFSLIPGYLLGRAIALLGLDLRLEYVSAFFLYPIAQLSTLESGSAVRVITEPVVHTMRLVWWAWLAFYAETAVLVAIAVAAGVGIGFDDLARGFWSVSIIVATIIVYYRILGRLAFCGSLAMGLMEGEFDEPPSKRNADTVHIK